MNLICKLLDRNRGGFDDVFVRGLQIRPAREVPGLERHLHRGCQGRRVSEGDVRDHPPDESELLPVTQIDLARLDVRRQRAAVRIKPGLLLVQVVVRAGGDRVVVDAAVHPEGAVERTVVPRLLHVVVDDIAVVYVAAGRRIEPPDLRKRGVGRGHHLLALVEVEVAEDIVPHSAGQTLHRTAVDIELLEPHPEDVVLDSDSRQRAHGRDVLRDQVDPEGERRTEVLHRVERGVCVDQHLLTRFDSGHNLGPRTKAQLASTVGRGGSPVGQAFLRREADGQRILDPGRCFWVTAKGDDVPVAVGHDDLLGDGRCGVGPGQRVEAHGPRCQTTAAIPVVYTAIARIDQQVLTEVVVAPQPQSAGDDRCRCSRAPRSSAPEAHAPACAEGRGVEADADLVRANYRCATVAAVRAVSQNRGGVQRAVDGDVLDRGPRCARLDRVGVTVNDAGDVVLLVEYTSGDVAAQACSAGEGDEIPAHRTVARVCHRDGGRAVDRGKGDVARSSGRPDRGDVVEQAAVLIDVILDAGAKADEAAVVQVRPRVHGAARTEERGPRKLGPAADLLGIPKPEADLVHIEPTALVTVRGGLAVYTGAELELGQRHTGIPTAVRWSWSYLPACTAGNQRSRASAQ
jgi:hypothetical protein